MILLTYIYYNFWYSTTGRSHKPWIQLRIAFIKISVPKNSVFSFGTTTVTQKDMCTVSNQSKQANFTHVSLGWLMWWNFWWLWYWICQKIWFMGQTPLGAEKWQEMSHYLLHILRSSCDHHRWKKWQSYLNNNGIILTHQEWSSGIHSTESPMIS